MGAVGAAFSVINPILTAVSAITGIVATVMGMSAQAKSAKQMLKFEVPTYKIPEQDLALLKQQIQANVQISDTARQIAIQALDAYRTGQLSPVYQDLLNKYSEERINALKAELAKRGIPEGSTIFNEAMARAIQDINAYKAMLHKQQLDDALKAAGLTQTTINELYNKWQVESGIKQKEAQTKLLEQYLKQQARANQAGMAQALGRTIADTATQLQRVFSKPDTSSQEKKVNENMQDKSLSYFLDMNKRREDEEMYGIG